LGADKNSSPKRELGLYPKFTTKDSHTSLPRLRSHDGRTNPRNKPQTIPKRKHEPRSKGLSYPAATQADCPRSPRGRSATHGGRSVKRRQNDQTRTSTRGRSVPRPRTVREQLVPRGLSATSGRTVRQTTFHQKPLANRIETKALKNTRRTRRTPGPKGNTRTVCTLLADCLPGVKTVAREPTREHPTTYPSMDLPNG
jgi:hypothetical protein